jgi:hypothetical protein
MAFCVRIAFILALVFCGRFALAQTPERISELSAPELDAKVRAVAATKQWHRLLHYRRLFPYFSYRSIVDGKDFFLSPEGKTDPEKELWASARGFFENRPLGRQQLHPQCAFPVRYAFVKRELKLTSTDVACPKLDEFVKKASPEAVSIVFSSAYPNNPGSMFGHTLMRFISRKKLDILDETVSYAAYVGGENDLEYIIRGLTGGYLGAFSMLPYYVKINEYNHSESRDLWEYELTLTPEESVTLLKVFWEIESVSWMSYFFFDENCASILLEALETVRPELDVYPRGPYVTPGEAVIRAAQVDGLVRERRFRPSLRRKLMAMNESMTPVERVDLERVINDELQAPQTNSVNVLDSANLYFQYLKQKQKGKFTAPQGQRAQTFLFRRSEIEAGSDTLLANLKIAPPEDDRPDLAHPTYRLAFSAGSLDTRAFQELHAKFALHDLLNRDEGYVRFSHIDFPSATLRYYPNDRHLRLEQLNFLYMTSLFPLTRLEKRFSWRIQTDIRSPKDFGCATCHVGHVEMGAGATLELLTPRWIAYSLGSFYGEISADFHKGYRWGPMLTLATAANPWNPYKIHFAADAIADLLQDDRQRGFFRIRLDQALAFGRSWDLRLELGQILPSQPDAPFVKEAKLGISHYF